MNDFYFIQLDFEINEKTTRNGVCSNADMQ
jgi:hypothetical protein